mgnify:FL=1
MELYKRIKELREDRHMSQEELALKTGYTSRTSIAKIEAGKIDLPQSKIVLFAKALDTTVSYLMGWEDKAPADDYSKIPNVLPLPKVIKKVPLYDGIACGDPRYADPQEVDMMELPDGIRADFAVRCYGDSMIDAHICDGDIVYIRQQDDVDDGEIAAVLIDDDATLKRVYRKPYGVVLMPANSNYEPLVYTAEDCVNIRIMGKAVACLSKVS